MNESSSDAYFADLDRVSLAQFQAQMQAIQLKLDAELSATQVRELSDPFMNKPQTLVVQKTGLSVLESRELRRKAILEDDSDEHQPVRASSGNLTLEMLGGDMPKKALEAFERSPQHPGDSYLSGSQSDIPQTASVNRKDQTINQNQIKTMASRQPNINQYGIAEEYSVEHFRKNNAQLQNILMQLQTPQFEDMGEPASRMIFPQDAQVHHSSAPIFNHLQSSGASNDVQMRIYPNPSQEVSQFNFRDSSQGRESHHGGINEPWTEPDYSKIQMLQNAIQQKAQFSNQPGSHESSNYRKTFQPQQMQDPFGMQMQQKTTPTNAYNQHHNPAFQNAAQTILDHKENFNQRNMDFVQRTQQDHLQESKSQGGRSSSQLRQAQEFTLQPSKSQPMEQPFGKQSLGDDPLAHAYVETMKHFDDIPISKIQKMTGYQTHPKDYVNEKDSVPQQQMADENEQVDASHLPLGERVINSNWRVRLEAYKEINQLFYSDYAKYESGDRSEPDVMASFDIYGPLLQQMIQDTNLVGAYEALVCLLSFVKFATSIKAVSFATHNTLLEKLQTNKPNLKEISTKILLTMLRRDQASFLFPELIKRFKSKNSRTSLFALHVINEAFKSNTAVEEIHLKVVFRSVQDCLNHNTLPIRELGYQILQHIYRHCGDEASRLIGFCRNLRPVQIKELTESLQKLTKNPKYAKNILFDQHDEEEFKPKEIEASKKEEPAKHDVEVPQPLKDKTMTTMEFESVDLLTLLPENFQEIPHMSKINAKKEIMEQFNTELQKLANRRNVTVKNKDYTMVFNISMHMLEDKNMLVYLEAIRNIELLSQLLGQQIKQTRVKQFLNLIANKYGELKTAVVAAVNKGLLAIVRHSFTPVLFAQECINQIAQTHKNPKVKQMVIEHALDQLLLSMDASQHQVISQMFRTTKEKMLVTITKDTNASVRDACVGLLSTYKALLPDDQSVQECINQLPKYRVNEILKKTAPTATEEDQEDNIPVKQEISEDVPVSDRPQFSKSMSQKLANMKKGPDINQSVSAVKPSFAQIILKGSAISQHYEKCIKPILDSFGQLVENDFGVRPDILESMWNENLLKLGEDGLPEVRPLLIRAVHQVVTTLGVPFNEHPNHFRSLLAFAKRLFVLNRQIVRSADGKSEELTQYLRISLLQNQWLASNQKETCQMLTVAMHATNNVFELNERLREVVDETIMLLSPAALQIIEAVYVWLGTNLNMFMARGLQVEDLEELRGFGIKYLDAANFSEVQRQALIGIMIKFKDLVSFQKAEIEKMRQVHRVDEANISKITEADESQTSLKQITSRQQTPQQETRDQPSRQGLANHPTFNPADNHPQTASFNQDEDERQDSEEEEKESKHGETIADRICKLIDGDFEKGFQQGLLMFKELAQNEPDLQFQIKEQIFDKLLSIISEDTKASQQQQRKQAYALKCLMWMREEAVGLQECFELTHRVMNVYSTSETEGHDSTVELYLLNFWTKELSVRDICDRISFCVLNLALPGRSNYSNFTAKQATEIDSKQIDSFDCLLAWFLKDRLFAEKKQPETWEISDLRKIVFQLCQATVDQKSVWHQVPKDFVMKTAQMHGHSKLREFFEIQLISKPDLFAKFAVWFDSNQQRAASATSKQSVPKVAIEKLTSQPSDQVSESRSHQSSHQKQAQQTPRGQADSATLSYKERRDQHKSKIAGGQEQPPQESQHSRQYENIIAKIEQNLQNVKQVTHQVSAKEEPNVYKSSIEYPSQIHQSNKGLRIEERQKSSEEDSPAEEEVAPMRKTNTSAYYQSMDKQQRYQAAIESHSSDDDHNEDELRDNLQMSELKSRHWMDKIRMLQEEKKHIESQSEVLQREKDEQSDQWREQVARMESEHKKVTKKLNEMNDQYSSQLSENEKLRLQLDAMQKQHAVMMSRFEEIERRINAPASPKQKTVQQTPARQVRATPSKELLVSIRKLDRIKDTFSNSHDYEDTQQELIVIQKIQDLLLSVEKNVEGELAQPLICHYQKLKVVNERMAMISAVREALDENEDVLLALSVDVYKAMLNFLLRAFSFEKQVLERMSVNQQGPDQNEITMESQRIVSKLLNSKEFTVSLVCLFQLLREAMPENLALQLSVEQRQYLRVLMRCIQRITKALQSEQPDLVRAFDVLIEMQKMFLKHPPEQLREDLPCLSDFDFVYRGMKEVSDKMVELQPEKVQSFLNFSADQPQNAFIKYLRSVTSHY